MTYCSICQKVTEDCKEENSWSTIFKLIIVHCEKCGHFKYQYLKNIEVQNSD